MNSLSSKTVVDQMVSELAERRHLTSTRRAAYLALARAILSDERPELVTSPTLDGYSVATEQPALAA